MIDFRTHSRSHRVYDPANGTFITSIGSRLPRWRPQVGGEPATVKACVVPGLADASARWMFGDPITNPSANTDLDHYLHLTKSGLSAEQRQPLIYPRYVYVVGGGGLNFQDTAVAMSSALRAQRAMLFNVGARLVFAGFTTDSPVTHAMAFAAPVAGGSRTEFDNGSYIVNLTSEDAEYDAGELFVAFVTDTRLGRSIYNTDLQAFGEGTYAGSVSDGADVPSGYSVIENNGDYQLLVNTGLAAYDAAIAQSHIDKYKRYRQHFYFPDVAIRAATGSDFGTGFTDVLSQVNPSGWPSSIYPNGSAASLATQIIVDAVNYFST